MRIDWAEIYPQVEKEKGEEKKVSTGSIDWEKLYPKVEKLLGEGKDKTEITEILDIPFPQLADKIALEEQKKYQKNKEQGQQTTIAGKQKDMKAADPTPQESVPTTNWDELWPEVKKDLEAGMSQAAASHKSRVFDQLKVKWIQDVIESEVSTKDQLVLIEQIQGLEVQLNEMS